MLSRGNISLSEETEHRSDETDASDFLLTIRFSGGSQKKGKCKVRNVLLQDLLCIGIETRAVACDLKKKTKQKNTHTHTRNEYKYVLCLLFIRRYLHQIKRRHRRHPTENTGLVGEIGRCRQVAVIFYHGIRRGSRREGGRSSAA